MTEPLNDPWFELRYLLTAIDSHQLTTADPSDEDNLLYWKAEQARKRVSQ